MSKIYGISLMIRESIIKDQRQWNEADIVISLGKRHHDSMENNLDTCTTHNDVTDYTTRQDRWKPATVYSAR